MAELIEKDALSEEIESLTVHVTGLRAGKGVLSKFMDEYRNSVLRIIDEQPTTTEAEIRASAISDFLQFVYDNASNEEYANEDGWAFSDLIDLEYKFLEQLKEEQ